MYTVVISFNQVKGEIRPQKSVWDPPYFQVRSVFWNIVDPDRSVFSLRMKLICSCLTLLPNKSELSHLSMKDAWIPKYPSCQVSLLSSLDPFVLFCRDHVPESRLSLPNISVEVAISIPWTHCLCTGDRSKNGHLNHMTPQIRGSTLKTELCDKATFCYMDRDT